MKRKISLFFCFRHQLIDKTTSFDSEFIHLFNLNLETNDNLLSPSANPHIFNFLPNSRSETTSLIRNGVEYSNRAISTGDDYPQWWLQLSTNLILSNYITSQGECKEHILSVQSATQHDQFIQTDKEQGLEIGHENLRELSSAQSARVHKSSSTVTMGNSYEIIDDENNARRFLPFTDRRQQVKEIESFFYFLLFIRLVFCYF